MTPQQRLQEAKDQAAKEFKIGERWFMPSVLEPFEKRMDRVAEIMYEAGKEEGDTIGWNNGYSAGSRDERKHTDNALKQEETYHKALEDLLDSLDLPADSEERAAEISIMKRKIQNALKP